ncbi:MAG: hypothetical protein HKP30_17880 [Myxococcales bacterium]|nr:hypothetical protein [Myxococcales bacterium]
MKRSHRLAVGLLCAALSPSASAEELVDVQALREMIEALRDDNQSMKQEMQEIRRELDAARDAARAASDRANDAAMRAGTGAGGDAAYPSAALWSRRMGRANVQLLDVSLNVLAAAGGSNANDDELALLQGGGHDPNQRGFTLQQLELSFLGAVDPYFTGEAHLLYFLDAEGESRFELEEAFATTTRLPFGLEQHGLALELGHFFTEFGRHNPRHPHAWDWQDQPIVNTRFFGGDGMRAPGVRAAWLTPLPWFAEIHVGVQNAKGETNPSFLANDEVFEERPIAGRPFASSGVRGSDDLVHLLRFVNGFDLGDAFSTQIGFSGLYGPNATGNDAYTWIAGADFVLKWRPIQSHAGWPFVIFEAEAMYRRYRADDFFGCFGEDGACDPGETPTFLEDDVFRDFGGYAQLLWGFRRNWAAGIRGEYATGGGDGFDAESGSFVSHDADPFRSQRYRISPLLVYHPTEFSRLRLQYNYDRDQSFAGDVAHSIWAGFEFSFGAHAAHGY